MKTLALAFCLGLAAAAPAAAAPRSVHGDPFGLAEVFADSAPVTPAFRSDLNEAGVGGVRVVKSTDLSGSGLGSGYTTIPLPAFTYNPNEGSWVGGILALFHGNSKGEIEDIYAPMYLHNRLIGETFTMNYFGYRHTTQQFHFVASHATKVEHTVDFSFKDTGVDDGHYILGIQANSGKSAFNRFYGFGNDVGQHLETTYAMGDSNLKAVGGVNLSPSVALLATERYRIVRIENGVSPTLPQTLDKFPDTPGIDGGDVLGQGLTLSYDTRDNQLTPLHGTYATAMAEFDQNLKFSERNQWWRLTAEARRFIPNESERMVFVAHFLADAVVGQDENATLEDFLEQDTGQVDALGNPIFQQVSTGKRVVRRGVPFYERPTLGGETTLRGFGRGRFVSNFALLLNLEERISLAQRRIMGNTIELEIAPFVDIGRVARSVTSEGFVRRMQVNPGVGVRVLARPNIAGRLDIAKGRDGTAVYVGLDYPF